MEFYREIYVEGEVAERINRLLSTEPTCKEECFGEDDKILFSTTFPDGMQMDVEVCGVQYQEEEDACNTAWTQAVLYDKGGCELTYSDVGEEYFGKWELEYNGNKYTVNVVAIDIHKGDDVRLKEKNCILSVEDTEVLMPEDSANGIGNIRLKLSDGSWYGYAEVEKEKYMERDFFTVYKEGGKKYLKYRGYSYCREIDNEDDDKEFAFCDVCSCEAPLRDVIKEGVKNWIGRASSECSQYIEEYTRRDAEDCLLHYFNGKQGERTEIGSINIRIPCGDYWVSAISF